MQFSFIFLENSWGSQTFCWRTPPPPFMLHFLSAQETGSAQLHVCSESSDLCFRHSWGFYCETEVDYIQTGLWAVPTLPRMHCCSLREHPALLNVSVAQFLNFIFSFFFHLPFLSFPLPSFPCFLSSRMRPVWQFTKQPPPESDFCLTSALLITTLPRMHCFINKIRLLNELETNFIIDLLCRATITPLNKTRPCLSLNKARLSEKQSGEKNKKSKAEVEKSPS